MGLGTTLLDKVMQRFVSKGALTVILPDGTSTTYGSGGEPSATIKINDTALPMALVKNPELVAGEAYMDGRLEMVDCTIHDFLTVFANNRDGLRKGPIRSKVKAWNKKIKRWHQRNPRAASSANVKAHYDISNELYKMFLDEDMQYSCAYFSDPDMTLEEAQLAKKRHIAAKLDLKAGQRVLDIGCGWGGMAMHLAKEHGVKVVGVTLSTQQHSLAIERVKDAGLEDLVDIRLQDYRDVEGPFDRIVSVGMFEHVGIGHFAEYFETIRELLTDEGVALVHSIGRKGGPGTTGAWIRKYIFPGGYSPALSETFAEIEKAGLWVSDCEILRLHYAYTLAEWNKRCQAQKAEIVEMMGEEFFRMWEFYLSISELSFQLGKHMNFQIQLTKDVHALPVTRDYMVDEERAQG
ncbi:class I SAM-dependent methyltransferase [Litorimonas sp. WD9-15]|uniref:class I SAM-dependent methyltransferase n=1 Tax=Litorimonas sp. WD9-15 TaxID=3418716 RepID=UPI003CFBC5B8